MLVEVVCPECGAQGWAYEGGEAYCLACPPSAGGGHPRMVPLRELEAAAFELGEDWERLLAEDR